MKKSLSLLTVAVLATMAGGVHAYTLTPGTDVVEDDFSYHGTETDIFGILVSGDATSASFTGSTIDVSTTYDSDLKWSYAAVANVGVRPTVDGVGAVTVEPWLLDFTGNLYDREVRVDFYEFLRPEQKFDGLDQLRQAILLNADQTRAYFAHREQPEA